MSYFKRQINLCMAATLMLLLLALPVFADGDHSRVIVLNTAGETSSPLITQGMVDALDAWGIIDRDNYDAMARGIHGERYEIDSRPIEWEASLARAQIAEIIDQGHDIIVAPTATLAQLVASATLGMVDPPTLIFVGVDDPYGAGLASSSCIKLPNITGSVSLVPYADVLAILPKLDPDIQTIGTLYNSSDAAGINGAAQIATIGEAMGLNVEVSAYTDFSTLTSAADGLLSKGIHALVLPVETGVGQALATVISPLSVDNNIPVIASDAGLTYAQATIGVGNLNHYLWGINVGRLLVESLEGELDIASAAISPASLELSVGINLSAAAMAGIEIPQALLDEADFVLENFAARLTDKGKQNTWHVESMRALGGFLERFVTPETYAFVQSADLPDLRAGQDEFIDSVRCTPKRIADEQAALDAADS